MASAETTEKRRAAVASLTAMASVYAAEGDDDIACEGDPDFSTKKEQESDYSSDSKEAARKKKARQRKNLAIRKKLGISKR